MSEKLFAFVLMPFDSQFDDVYHLGIKAAAEELGITAVRVDEQVFHDEGILERIYNEINKADLIIADMTGKNPNVFYEVGYAHAKGKRCILLTTRVDDIPFDLKHRRHIVYGNSIVHLKDKLKVDMEAFKLELPEQGNLVTVELAKIEGSLDFTKYSEIANVHIALDFHNRSSKHSAYIETIYFYTGSGWSFNQDNRECPQTGSDIPGYTTRHLIQSPLPRLQKGMWAQVKLVGKKVMRNLKEGEDWEASYRIKGTALVRIVTERAIFDSRSILMLRHGHFSMVADICGHIQSGGECRRFRNHI
jgi:nucleoside 2-deoxyribosyltransferase